MSDGDLSADRRAIAFVDLAGFTALTDAHGDEQAVQTQQTFVRTLRTCLLQTVECVKHLGDGAMLAAEDPLELLRCLHRLAGAWAADPAAPLLRIGAHQGAVIVVRTEHGTDYLGATVNIAARLGELAAGGQLVHSDAMAGAAAAAGFLSLPLGQRRLRGVGELVGASAVDLTGGEEPTVDPVCRMPVPDRGGAGQLTYEGRKYAFCSLACAGRFAAAPRLYLGG